MENYRTLIEQQRAFFQTHRTKDIAFRTDALKRLYQAIRRHEDELMQALKSDLNKSDFEAYSSEIGIVLKEISFACRHLHAWAKPVKAKSPLTHLGSRSSILYEPYGVALIISPWNFPFQLAVSPLVGAIAAGNCAILKPSELTPRTSDTLARLVRDTFPANYISVVTGGTEVSQALLNEKTDYIFFTGGTAIGKVVMEAAAKHLTPVTLELGGKSPCIVHEDAHLKLAAKRIAWGKFINAGQTCVAPDYVYVHRSIKSAFVAHLQLAIAEQFGTNPLDSGNYTRIVSERHFERLQRLLGSGRTAYGGRHDRNALLMEPTVLTDVTVDDPIMQEEIFGPILPILEYDHLEAILSEINARPKPLALYLFSEDKDIQRQVLTHTSFGGGCINDTVYHLTTPYLPFGGVGDSGIGAYHGRSSFELFSHRKSILKQTTRFDLPFRYPHFKHGLRIIKRFLK